MVPIDRTIERILAIFLLGVLLLLPPVLLVFNFPIRVLGVPVLYLFIFIVWAVLIALATAIARQLASHESAPGTNDGSKAAGAPAAAEWVRDA